MPFQVRDLLITAASPSEPARERCDDPASFSTRRLQRDVERECRPTTQCGPASHRPPDCKTSECRNSECRPASRCGPKSAPPPCQAKSGPPQCGPKSVPPDCGKLSGCGPASQCGPTSKCMMSDCAKTSACGPKSGPPACVVGSACGPKSQTPAKEQDLSPDLEAIRADVQRLAVEMRRRSAWFTSTARSTVGDPGPAWLDHDTATSLAFVSALEELDSLGSESPPGS